MTGAYLAYQEALIVFDRTGTAGLRTAMRAPRACGFRNHNNYVLRIAIHAGHKRYPPGRKLIRPTPRSTR